MKLRIAAVVGFVFGVTLANCGKDPTTLEGTALYVVAYFRTAGYDIRSLYFSGQTAGGNDLFEATYRPLKPSAASLVSPQRVRVFLGDELGDKKVTLSLYAVDTGGELVQFGSATVTVQRGHEVEVPIEMAPFDLPHLDGGADDGGEYVDSGFLDAGTIDAGRLPDGGMLQCNCNGGCCFPGTSTCLVPGRAVLDAGAGVAPVIYTFGLCGPAGSFCPLALCDASHTNSCRSGKCSCGEAGICPSGTRCTVGSNGSSSCLCDVFSQCQGCCTNGGAACVGAGQLSRIACGSAGQSCTPCGAAAAGPGVGGDAGTAIFCSQATAGVPSVEQPGVCSTSTSCAGCTGASLCCSEMRCVSAGWPRCKRPNANVCLACDLLRTDSCSAEGCSCGKETTVCSALQFCDRTLAVPRCKAF